MKPVSALTGVVMTFVGGTLDAYTYLSHGVFATAQTGNVVFLLIGAFTGKDPWRYLLPIIAFVLVVLVVQPVKHLASEARARAVITGIVTVEILLLIAVGFLPVHIPSDWVAVPLSALGGLQLGLFRSAANVSFVSIATTGNLMRLAEAGYEAIRAPGRESLRAVIVCAAIVAAFAAGATAGVTATLAFHSRGIWVSAAAQCVVLVLVLAGSRAPNGETTGGTAAYDPAVRR